MPDAQGTPENERQGSYMRFSGFHVNANGLQALTIQPSVSSARSSSTGSLPLPRLQSRLLNRRRETERRVLKAEGTVKHRRRRDSNPVLETRSANHQHLLLFFFKLGKGQKAKPEKTKDFVFSGKEKPFTTLWKGTAGESASAKLLAWPSLLCSPEKVLAESFCNPTQRPLNH